jgi:uncharacterized protein with PIN domain
MTFDARTLMSIVRKGPGYELALDAIIRDPCPRVCATSLAELAILLNATGDRMSTTTVGSAVYRLNLSVVPFLDADWSNALEAYKASNSPAASKPRFSQCLVVATAARTGSELYQEAG